MPDKDVQSLNSRGETLSAEGRLDEAAEAYAEALELEHDNVAATLGLASIAFATGLPEEAAQLLDRTLSLAPELVEARVLRGLVDEGRGELDRALDGYARAAAAGQDAYAARYHLGRALAVAGRHAEALVELRAAAELEPEALEPLYALAVAARESGDLASAIEALTHALEVDPAYLDGSVTLADLLCEAGRLELAEQVLQHAAALYPDVGVVHGKIAAVRLRAGDLAGTLAALREQVRVKPLDEEAPAALFAAGLAANDAQAAADAVDALLERHPSSWRSHFLHAKLLDLADRPERAVEALREARRLAPERWEPLNDLGSLLNARALREPPAAAEALEVLEAAVAVAPPEEPAPRYNLALARWNAGPREAARAALRELLADAALGAEHAVRGQAREVLEAMDAEPAAP